MGSVWRVEKSEPHGTLLERVRKLLAMAEGDGVTQAEAEAFTEKAAGLMARYGIDRALLAAARPDTDRPGNRLIDVPNPWADVRAHLLAGLVTAMRCQCVLLPVPGPASGCTCSATTRTWSAPRCCTRRCSSRWRTGWPPRGPAHRAERAGLAAELAAGLHAAVIARVRAAEERAASDAGRRQAATGPRGPGARRPVAGRPAAT